MYIDKISYVLNTEPKTKLPFRLRMEFYGILYFLRCELHCSKQIINDTVSTRKRS